MDVDTRGRHPSTQGIIKHFSYHHLPPALQEVSKPVAELAAEMVCGMPDGPELTAGLRKLLEAKDCFVRAKLEQIRGS